MAALDTIQFAGLMTSTYAIAPTMTVILLHINTPCIILLSRYMFPERQYSSMQLKGTCLIGAAVLISFLKSTLVGDVSSRTIYSTAFFVFFASLQSVSTLYKEKFLIEFSQPIDLYQLSFWLFSYQSLFMIIISPLIYIFQGIYLNSCLLYLTFNFINLCLLCCCCRYIQ